MVKNPPAKQKMQETQVQFLGQEDPLEEEMANHSSILAWKNSMDNLMGYGPWSCKESDMTEWLSTQERKYTSLQITTQEYTQSLQA